MFKRILYRPVHQIRLVIQHGIRSRARSMLIALVRQLFGFIHRHPVFARRVLNLSQKTGMEPAARRLYVRLRQRNQQNQKRYASTILPLTYEYVRELADAIETACASHAAPPVFPVATALTQAGQGRDAHESGAMRIVIDLQSAQGSSRFRGMGRYSLAIALAIARNRGNHEVLIALNGSYHESIQAIRMAFAGILPSANIRVWHTGAINREKLTTPWEKEASECVKEIFLASLEPDLLYVTSHFEGGPDDDLITSIGKLPASCPVAVTLYDLIPLVYPDIYFANKPWHLWYVKKLADFQRANLWLGISESASKEGISLLNLPTRDVVTISTDADAHFCPAIITPDRKKQLFEKFGIQRPFLMYTGGVDHRKNLDGLVRAFALLPTEIRTAHQLVIVCQTSPHLISKIDRVRYEMRLNTDEVILTGNVEEDDLVDLYRLTALFVFPSLHEGFGLPALEAIRCGAPVIAADNSSLPEVVGWDQALFDMTPVEAMVKAISRALTNTAFRNELIQRQGEHARTFSWDRSAQIAISAFERLHRETSAETLQPSGIEKRRLALVYAAQIDPVALLQLQRLMEPLCQHYAVELVAIDGRRPETDMHVQLAQFDRVLYSFDQIKLCQPVAIALDTTPGVSMLHTARLTPLYESSAGLLNRELLHSHGYHALLTADHDQHSGLTPYTCSLSILQQSLGIITSTVEVLRDTRVCNPEYSAAPTLWHVMPALQNPVLTEAEAQELYTAIEGFYRGSKALINALPGVIAQIPVVAGSSAGTGECLNVAWAIARSILPAPTPRQLFVDISELVVRNAKTGIQRVVSNILTQWLKEPPGGWRVEPVYATYDNGYRYARQFVCEHLGVANPGVEDDTIACQTGDTFLFLDLQHHVAARHRDFYQIMREQGVTVKFLIYDLLPITLSRFFLPGVTDAHHAWLEQIAETDGCICISRTVADETRDWMMQHAPRQLARADFSIDYFHLGANIEATSHTRGAVTGLTEKETALIASLKAGKTFLMVGTLEPRKGHLDILNAFEVLWCEQVDVNLVFVGKAGWLADSMIQRVTHHIEFGKRFIWLNGINDVYLNAVYAASSCLIIGSEGEGFGLPVYEAAQHGLPIIARDIPVFRELAGANAHYFIGHEAAVIAASIRNWLILYDTKQHPTSENIEWLTWQQSAQQLASVLLKPSGTTGPA